MGSQEAAAGNENIAGAAAPQEAAAGNENIPGAAEAVRQILELGTAVVGIRPTHDLKTEVGRRMSAKWNEVEKFRKLIANRKLRDNMFCL